MGLLVADPDLDAVDLEVENEDDPIEEDLDRPCLCDHQSVDHGPAGCRASVCPCGARCDLEDLAGEDQDDEAEEQVAQRVAAVLVATARRRKRLDQARSAAAAEDTARWPLAQKAPRRNKADSRGAAASPPPPPAEISLSDTYGLSLLEKDALEALGGAVLN